MFVQFEFISISFYLNWEYKGWEGDKNAPHRRLYARLKDVRQELQKDDNRMIKERKFCLFVNLVTSLGRAWDVSRDVPYTAHGSSKGGHSTPWEDET